MTSLLSRPSFGAPEVDLPDFPAFYAEFAPRLQRYARRWLGAGDADDVAQETLARALARWPELDHARDLWPWLSVVARNLAFDQLRARRTCAIPDDDLPCGGAVHEWDSVPERAAETAERADLLQEVFAGLSARQQQVLRLRLSNGMSFADIASLLGVSEVAVRQQLLRARRNMAARFLARGGTLPAVAPGGVALWAASWLRRRLRDLTAAAGPAASLAVAVVTAVVVSVPATPAPALETAAASAAASVTASRPATETAVAAGPAPAAAVAVPTPSAPDEPAPRASLPAETPAEQTLPVTPSMKADLSPSPLAPGEQLSAEASVMAPLGTVFATTEGQNEGNGPVCSAGLVDCS